jgi:hypothetical protein
LDSNTWSKRTESHGAELPTDSVAKSCREIETGQAQIIAGLQISCVATGFATTGATGLNILTLQVLQVLLLERSQRTSFMIEAGLPPTSPLHETKPNLHETRIRLKLGHYVTQGTSMTIWQHGHNIKDAYGGHSYSTKKGNPFSRSFGSTDDFD